MAVLEETSISCVFVTDILEDVVDDIEVVDANTVKFDVGTNVPYTLDKIDAFQGDCANGLTPGDGTVLQDFDIIVETFNQHYSYFEDRGITDWQGITSQARQSLTTNSNNQDLAFVLESILGLLTDPHVFISFEAFDYEFVSKPNSFFARLDDEFEQQTNGITSNDYFNGQLLGWFDTLATYVSTDGLDGTPGLISWGGKNVDGINVGYLNIFTFGPGDESGFINSFRTALVQLALSADVLIIDIRVNTGGSDVLAVFLASHFASERTLAYTLQPRDGQTQGGLIEPASEVYMETDGLDITFPSDKPIFLLQSDASVSAAEPFALSMIQLPQVTTVGENTAGALSDTMERNTPNGWTFGLSNEYVKAPNGDVYEGFGIPANVIIPGPVLPLAEREAGVDTWLEIAIEQAIGAVAPSMAPSQSPTISTSSPTVPDSGSSRLASSFLTVWATVAAVVGAIMM